jgi:hypothetical protein
MAKTQQDVRIYKEKSFSTAQSQFEKDLKKRQREGWRLVSVTPTKKRGFGRIVQLTAIYEKDVLDGSYTSAATSAQAKAIEAAIRAENKAKARTERQEKFKEAQRRTREKEQAYRDSLSPEQLQQYLKRKRRKNLIVATVLLVAFILCVAVTANNPAIQTFSNSPLTPVPTDTPVPPTHPPATNQQKLAALLRTDSDADTYCASDVLVTPPKVLMSGGVVNVTVDVSNTPFNFDNDRVKHCIFAAEDAIWNSGVSGIVQVTITVKALLQDKYGNQSTGDIGRATLGIDTEKKFVWKNITYTDAWDLYDSKYLLP